MGDKNRSYRNIILFALYSWTKEIFIAVVYICSIESYKDKMYVT